MLERVQSKSGKEPIFVQRNFIKLDQTKEKEMIKTAGSKYTFLAKSDSSSMAPMSRPCADASRLPCTMLPTMTDAGPTSGTVTRVAREPHYKTNCCGQHRQPNKTVKTCKTKRSREPLFVTGSHVAAKIRQPPLANVQGSTTVSGCEFLHGRHASRQQGLT